MVGAGFPVSEGGRFYESGATRREVDPEGTGKLMPRSCTVCTHPDRPAIDLALVNGVSGNAVAAKYRVSEDAVVRHCGNHLPAALAQGQAAAEMARADDLLGQLQRLQADARRIGGKAEDVGDLKTALMGVRELVRIVELAAKLVGELDERPQVNVLLAPEWTTVRVALLAALRPFPEARVAVAERLADLEAAG